MAYSELIKNFERIRDYMREFYVYGFKSREEFTKKSARSYDDERRRIESWLGDYMGFRQTPDGKNVFLSIDSRISHHNPLYKAWKAKSFTDGDITLHFLIFDLLHDPKTALSLNELAEEIDKRLSGFDTPKAFDVPSMDEYREQMRNVYTTCVVPDTLDESPMAYKSMDEIVAQIEPTAQIAERIHPIYNFKAAQSCGRSPRGERPPAIRDL